MARTGKPAGNKKTSFGKRTEAERSFRDRKKEARNESSQRSGRGNFSKPSKFSSSRFDKENPRSERRSSFGARPDSEKPFRKKSGSGFSSEEGSASRENRFSRTSNFSKPRFDRDKPREDRKSSFRKGSDSRSFERKKGPRYSKNESGFQSDEKKYSKPFEKREGVDRFSKFRKENEKPFRSKSDDFEKREKREFKKRFPPREKKSFRQFDQSKSEAPQSIRQESADGLIRLNKFMANSGVGSRREADEYIKMGLVTVNGVTITEMGHKVKSTDDVRYEGRKLKAEPMVYILLNKPKGFITTTDDPEDRKTVMELVASACKERIYPVGRLDRNTTGLLLLTNDGDLADKLTHPSYNAKKIYKVEVDRPLTKADFQKILDGVYFEEGRAQVDDLAMVSDDGKEVGIEIHIGWNRIVRRIFEALGYKIERLDRVMYAGLDKKDLGRGQWRFLKPEEVVRLKHFNG
jgi:23S rRNA pseudouridine2605 synthase